MRNMLRFLTNRKMLLRIILSYFFVGLLVIALLTVLITSRVTSDWTGELDRSTDRAIEQSYNTASILLKSAYDNYGTAFAGADIQSGFYNRDFSTGDLGRIGSKLTELSGTNPLVHSIYVLNSQRKLAFSSLTTVQAFDDFYDQGILQLLDRIEPNRNGIFYPRHIQYEINGRTYDNNLISLIYVNSIGKIMSGAMIVNLDQQVLQSMVMNGAGGKSFQSMILNKQGTVISHSNSAMINASLAGEDDVRQIQSSDSPRGSLEMTKNGRSYRISYIKSDSLGWTFIGVIDYESLLSQVKEMKRFILTVTGVMLLFVVLLGGFFTGWIYGPIHRLMMNVRNLPVGGEDVQGVSELDLLGGTITYLEHKIHDLQRSVADYQSAKRHEVLGLLTAGGWSNEAEIRKRLEKVGVTWEYNRFIAVMLKIDSYRKLSAAYKPSDIALFKYAISNIATEVGSGRFTVVCYDCGEDGVAMIANLPDGSHEPVQELAEVLRDIQLHIHKFLKLSVTVSIGPFVRSMADIKTSWETARKASLYRLIMGKGAIIDSSIEETRESLQDSQVGGLEKQIMDRLKLGDMDKVEKAVSQFIGYVQSASFDEMMLSFTQLLISTARTMKAMVAADPKELTLDIGTLCGQLGQWETIGEIETWYLGLCEKAASLRDSQAQHKNKWIVDKILRYIDEHYADSNLTVETLVEAGALSMNYTRKLFKDRVGKSIAVYLGEYRFQKARALLLETDLPANKIGEMVGFENTNYFYVSFKKHYGMTPDHFRKHPLSKQS